MNLDNVKRSVRRCLGKDFDPGKSCVRATRLTSNELEFIAGWTAGAALVSNSTYLNLADFWIRNRRAMNANETEFISGYRTAILCALQRRA